MEAKLIEHSVLQYVSEKKREKKVGREEIDRSRIKEEMEASVVEESYTKATGNIGSYELVTKARLEI